MSLEVAIHELAAAIKQLAESNLAARLPVVTPPIAVPPIELPPIDVPPVCELPIVTPPIARPPIDLPPIDCDRPVVTPPIALPDPPVVTPPIALPDPTPTPQAVTVDSEGLPWDGRIHSRTKSFLVNGTWKLRRHVDKDTVTRVRIELVKAMTSGPLQAEKAKAKTAAPKAKPPAPKTAAPKSDAPRADLREVAAPPEDPLPISFTELRDLVASHLTRLNKVDRAHEIGLVLKKHYGIDRISAMHPENYAEFLDRIEAL